MREGNIIVKDKNMILPDANGLRLKLCWGKDSQLDYYASKGGHIIKNL